MRRPHLRALTGVRFFAAAHVVAYHYGRNLVSLPRSVVRLLEHGFAGVTLFFVLSGFILAYNHAGDGVATPARSFWSARFARIYPVYLLGLLLALPALLAPAPWAAAGPHGGRLALAMATTPFLLQGWVPRVAGVWNGPAWSLSAEALFYALFPLVVLGVTRLRRRGLLVLAGAAWATSLALVGLYVALRPDGSVWPGMPTAQAPWLGFLRYHPLARLPEFVLGIAAGRLLLLRPERMRAPWGRPAAEVVALVALLATLALVVSPVTVPFPMVHGGLLAALFAVALYALALAGARGPLSWLLSTGFVVLLGEASYALYILHVPLHDLALRALALTGWRPGGATFFGVYFALAVAASILVHKLYEVPARRLVRGWLERRRRVRMAPAQQAAQAA